MIEASSFLLVTVGFGLAVVIVYSFSIGGTIREVV